MYGYHGINYLIGLLLDEKMKQQTLRLCQFVFEEIFLLVAYQINICILVVLTQARGYLLIMILFGCKMVGVTQILHDIKMFNLYEDKKHCFYQHL